MRIDIYIDTDARGLYKRDRGATWFLMESTYKDKPIKKSDRVTWYEQNRNGAALEGILYALSQIRAKDSELYVHVNNIYICGYSKKLEEWKKNGFMNKKGYPIKYRELWKRISEMQENRKNRLYFSRDVPERKNEKK